MTLSALVQTMPKISVIVPVYNVEPYLRKCIDSLLIQTLKDIEIILVDDGSTDASGTICDKYAKTDNRIQVIHKANEGLSCARNDGIDASSAPFLMFVDSDDWVEPRFCEIPYKEAERNHADLVIFRTYFVKNEQIHRTSIYTPTGVVDAETALMFGGVAVWKRLYDRNLFSKLRFPAGMVSEDIAVMHKLVFAARRIAMINDVLYHYVYRENSISNSHSVKAIRDAFFFANQRAEELRAHGCAEETYERLLYSTSLGLLIREEPSNDPVFKQAEAVTDAIGRIPRGLSRKKTAMLLIWKTNKQLFHFLCRVFGKKEQK